MTFILLALQLAAVPQQAPPAAPPAAEAPPKPVAEASSPEQLGVSLDRIKNALAEPPKVTFRTERPVFRLEVFGKKPTIEDILGPDYLKGPTPAGPTMTHQEFLDMVTPKDVQGYAAFSNKEGLVVAATSIALQWAVQKAIHKFETALNEREREAARKEVQDALAELAKARKAAGLPPK
ncbi:MAG TPA: hypothetical protein VF147_07125 [Vicinamibacterales bacterium]